VHALIYRSTRNDAFEVLQTKLVLSGDETVFDVDISTLSDGYYTLGFIFENDEYVMDITGIGKDAEGTRSIAESAGLTVENISFLQNNGDFMRFGHKTTVNEIVVSDLPQSIEARWSRSWFIDFTDENTQGGGLKFTFNYSNGHLPETPTGVHALIKRSNENSSFEIVATQLILSGTETAFTVNVNDLGDGFYTLGLVKNFAAENGDHVLDFTGIYRIDPFLITANQSAGLIIENKSYLYDNWDYVVWGHNTPEITLYN
jgi:azurin